MLLKFPESDIVLAIQRVSKAPDQESAARNVAEALGKLLRRSAETFGAADLPLHLHHWWTRLSALLIHFIVYFVDVSVRNVSPLVVKLFHLI